MQLSWSAAFNVHHTELENKKQKKKQAAEKNDILNLKTTDLQMYLRTRKSIDPYWT